MNGLMLTNEVEESNGWKKYFKRILSLRGGREVEENCLWMGLLRLKGMNVRILVRKRLGVRLER